MFHSSSLPRGPHLSVGLTPQAATKRSSPSIALAPAPQTASHHPLASRSNRAVPCPQTLAQPRGEPRGSNPPNSFGPDSPATTHLKSQPPISASAVLCNFSNFLCWEIFVVLFWLFLSGARGLGGLAAAGAWNRPLHSRVLQILVRFCWWFGFDLMAACF